MFRVYDKILDERVTNQFPLKIFSDMIVACLDLIETFQMMLNDNNYYISYDSHYGIKIHTDHRPKFSKIESFMIDKYDKKEFKEDFILKYYDAYKKLTIIEKQVFKETFVDRNKDLTIIQKLNLNSYSLNKIRKSAIVKFALTLGFDKLKSEFE